VKGLSTFRRGFVSTLSFDIVSRGMSAVVLVLLLRSLDVEDFAFIVLLLNVGQFLGSAATGGIRMRYSRIEAERFSRRQEEPSAFNAALLSGSGLIVLAAVLGLLGATTLGLGDDAVQRLAFVGLGTGYTLAHATVELAVYHHQAQLAFFRAGVIRMVRSGVLLGISLAATLGLLDSGFSVGLAFAIGVGAVAVAFATPLSISTRGATLAREGRFGFGRETATLTFYSITTAGWRNLSLFLVAALLNDAAVAAYGAALRYVLIVFGPVPSIISVLRVRTAQQDMIDSDEAQVDMLKRWARQAGLPTLGLLATVGVIAIWGIPLLDGGRYPDSVPIFQVLLVGAFAQFVTLPSPNLLVAQKRYTTLAWVNAGGVAFNAALAVVAAELFGVVGIAAAASLMAIVQAGAATYLAVNPPPGAKSAIAEGTDAEPALGGPGGSPSKPPGL